jgi:hypothetical protein
VPVDDSGNARSPRPRSTRRAVETAQPASDTAVASRRSSWRAPTCRRRARGSAMPPSGRRTTAPSSAATSSAATSSSRARC